MKFENLILLLRLTLLPIIINLIYLSTPTALHWALFLLVLAGFSSLLNYIFFRKNSEVSSFVDPFVTKIMIMSLLFTVVLQGWFSYVPFLIFIFRDLGIVVVRWFASQEDIQMKERKLRDLLMAIQFLLLVLILLQHSFFWTAPFSIFIFVLTILSILLALLSVANHVLAYSRGLQQRIQVKKQAPGSVLILANDQSRGYHDAYRRHLLKVFARRRRGKILFMQPGRYQNEEPERVIPS